MSRPVRTRLGGEDRITPAYLLTADDALAGHLVALRCALRRKKLGQVEILVHELLAIAQARPPASSAEIALDLDHAAAMSAEHQRCATELAPARKGRVA